MRQRSRLVVLALAALVGLAGCAGSPGSEAPAPTQSVESSQPPASEVEVPEPEELEDVVPTPEPLSLPEYPEDLTAEDTAENAILAAEYFLDLMNYAQSSGDVAPFEEVAAQSCASCERYVERQKGRYASGGFSNGNHATMVAPSAARTEDGLAWVVTSDWSISPGERYEAEDGELIKIPGNELLGHRLGVQVIEDDWKMLTFAEAAK